MKKIILSLALILLLGAVTYGTTKAVFSSSAVMGVNTFATGTLQIRLNGETQLTGFTFGPAAPGDCTSGQFGVNNYGAPYFGGPSNLAAKELVISAVETAGSDTSLFNALTLKIEANRGWPNWMQVYNSWLNGMNQADLLSPNWPSLAAGDSEDVRYTVCLPVTADSTLQGKEAKFNFVVDAYNPKR